MQIAEFTNESTGVRSVVVQAADGLFDVAAFDIDANMMITSRHGFKSEAAAVEFAKSVMVGA